MQISQSNGSGGTELSNVVGGFQIQTPPPASPLAPGSVLVGFLEGSLQAAKDLQTSITTTSLNSANMQGTLAAQVSQLESLITQVEGVVNGTSRRFTIGQFNGSSVEVAAPDLAKADRLLLSVLAAYTGPEPDLSPFGLSLAHVPRNLSSAGTASNAIQAAAQAAFTDAQNPDTLVSQLSEDMTNLTLSFARANPADVATGIAIGLGVVGAVVAIDTVGLPTLPALALALH